MEGNTSTEGQVYEALARYHWSNDVRENAPMLMRLIGDREVSLGIFHTHGGASAIAERERTVSPFARHCTHIETRVEAR